MSLPVKILPTLDGSRAATDARLGAWLRECHDDAVDDALCEARGEVDELHTLATYTLADDEVSQQQADQHLERVRQALDAVADLHTAS